MRSPITHEKVSQIIELAQVNCGWITHICWSPIGDILAIASADAIRLYVGGFGGTPTHVLNGHSGHVKAVAFNPDGTRLASVSSDTTVRLWDINEQGQQVTSRAVLNGHTGSVDTVAFSPTGQSLATGGGDKTIRLWDLASNSMKAMLQGHTAEITGLTFALGGNILVSGSWDKTVRLWDVANETAGAVLGEHDDWVREVTANPPGTMIASAGKDDTVRFWDAYAEERYALIQAHDGGVDSVSFSPDGKLLATGGRDNVIRVWSVDQALRQEGLKMDEALIILKGHDKPVLSLAFNATGTMLASGSGDNTVRLWGIPATKS